MEVNLSKKFQHEKNNPIDWENRKWIICNFPLEINTKDSIETTAKEMSTLYFVIRKEHKFLRNVLSESKSKEYVPLESLTSYYYTFTKFLKNQYCYMSFDNISKC